MRLSTTSSVLIALCLAVAALPAQEGQPTEQPTASRADALVLYKQGRDLEAAGRTADAATKYRESVEVCDRELASDPTRMDAYTVKCWSLFRLERYREVVDIGTAALKVKFDARVLEVMGEAYFHLGNDAESLRLLQRYVENSGEYGDRVPTAYFYMAECYFRMKRYDHADIAYAMATYREPGIARWWYRFAGNAEAVGDYGKAYDLYGKALALNPGLPEAVAGQARVGALR